LSSLIHPVFCFSVVMLRSIMMRLGGQADASRLG
jgi:hypothetical protein